MTNRVKQKLEKFFSDYMIYNVKHYQNKYGFDMDNNSTHNNEADAFKHTFMQAFLSLYGTQGLAKILGDMHEKDGNLRSQPKGEEIMDLHNNQQGRAIAKEIIKQYGLGIKNITLLFFTNDLIAERVWQRMKEGKIILDPSGRTKLKKDNKNNSLFKLSINENVNLSEQDKKIERYKKEKELFSPENRVFFEGEINPAKVPYGSEEDKYVPAMLKQFYENGNKLPKESELKESVNSGGLIYVDDYVRQDGTHVSGYYRRK